MAEDLVKDFFGSIPIYCANFNSLIIFWIMKEIISFSVKVLLAFAVGVLAASLGEEISRYHYAEVVLFFVGAIVAFYFFEGLTKKIFRL